MTNNIHIFLPVDYVRQGHPRISRRFRSFVPPRSGNRHRYRVFSEGPDTPERAGQEPHVLPPRFGHVVSSSFCFFASLKPHCVRVFKRELFLIDRGFFFPFLLVVRF